MSENLDLVPDNVDADHSVDAPALEVVDLKSVPLSKPGRKDRAYQADTVDSLLELAQQHLDYREALIKNLNRALSEASAPTDDSEQIGLLQAANAELRHRLQEALKAQDSTAEQATGLLQHAHRVAEEHIRNAQEQAAQIVQDAHDSLASLHEEINRAEARKQEVYKQIRSLVADLDG